MRVLFATLDFFNYALELCHSAKGNIIAKLVIFSFR